MSTTTGDIATFEDGLGGKGKTGNMKDFVNGIHKINADRLKRYDALIKKGGVSFPERTNMVKRVNPKRAKKVSK